MPEIELLDASHARGIWAMHDVIEHPDYRLEGYGHYHDDYVKQGGRWRIARTRLVRLREDRRPRGRESDPHA